MSTSICAQTYWFDHVEICKSWYFHHVLFCSRKCFVQFSRPQGIIFLCWVRGGITVGVVQLYQCRKITDWLNHKGSKVSATSGCWEIWYCLCDWWVYVVPLWWQLEPHKCDPWLAEYTLILSLHVQGNLLSWHRCRNFLTCARWFSTSLSYTTISSTIHLNPIKILQRLLPYVGYIVFCSRWQSIRST